MYRFVLAITAGVLNLAFVAGALATVRTDTATQIPPGDNVLCYYNQATCAYDNGAYWSGCDSSYPAGSIPTGTAKLICEAYHSA